MLSVVLQAGSAGRRTPLRAPLLTWSTEHRSSASQASCEDSFYLRFTGQQWKLGDFLGQNCQTLSKQFVINSQLRLDSPLLLVC